MQDSEPASWDEAAGSTYYTPVVSAAQHTSIPHLPLDGSRLHLHFPFLLINPITTTSFRLYGRNQLVCQPYPVTRLQQFTFASMQTILIKSFWRTGPGRWIHRFLLAYWFGLQAMVLQLHCLFYTLGHIGGISAVQRVIAERSSKSRQAVVTVG